MGKKEGIGLFGLVGMVISGCIGTGAFALTGQLSGVASPGAILIAWGIVGVGFIALCLSMVNVVMKRPDLPGIFSFAEEGFGKLAGFMSGWGYWLSAWLGSIAFATMMMSTLGYFIPMFLPGNSLPCVIIASVVMWALAYLVIRGVESAAFLNAIVMVCKFGPLVAFFCVAAISFNAGLLTEDFWGNVYNNAVAAANSGEDLTLGGVGAQVTNCFIIMMWCFVGVEGAVVMSGRARKRSDVGKATIGGVILLCIVYTLISVLPYGCLPWTEISQMDYPALLYVFNALVPGFGGAFVAAAIIMSVLGAWLSFTILPVETTADMAERKLLPASWGKLNKYGAPQMSIIIVSICIQIFLFVVMLSSDAYDFAVSMCTVTIMFTWILAAAYSAKISIATKDIKNIALGVFASAFLAIATLINGWTYLLLVCAGYVPGFVVYVAALREQGLKVNKGEKITMAIVGVLAILAVALLAIGVITI